LRVNANEDQLLKLLEEHQGIGSVKKDDELIIANINQQLEASELNSYLFNKGVTLSHLVKRKPSLEQQFLDLTNNN
ncbi:MAG: ABC transporter ATP-binding protein, partial [Flavobacteriaceae bacterium]|nr:ABC transporter ATP-binding protein [Flavobacteriaceae bacterium]